jgi:hypothetical protein
MASTFRYLLIAVAILIAVVLALPVLDPATRRQPAEPKPRPGRSKAPPRMIPAPNFWISLAGTRKVQDELALSDEQKAKLQSVDEDAQERMRGVIASTRDMSPGQRRATIRELAQDQAQGKTAIRDVLSDKQFQRLVEIAMQVRVVYALADKEIQKTLGLSAEQAGRIASIRELGIGRIQEARQRLAEGEATPQEIRLVQEEMQQQVLALLTPEQTKKLAQMKGVPINLDPAELMGPGGRGRGGAGPMRGGPRGKRSPGAAH